MLDFQIGGSVLADALLRSIALGIFLVSLLIGNTLMGLLQAFLIRLIFKVRGCGLVFWAIAANYVSAIAGIILINGYSDAVIGWVGGSLPIYAVWRILLVLALASFLLTVLIEWPFYWLAMGPRSGGWKRSLRATLLVNVVSYILLAGWYWTASPKPFDWGGSLCRASEMTAMPDARVFYLSPDGKEVWQVRLDWSAPSRFCALPTPEPNGVLGFWSTDHAGYWQLASRPAWNKPWQVIAEVGPCRATSRPTEKSGEVPIGWQGFPFTGDLQVESSRTWEIQTGSGGVEGVRVRAAKPIMGEYRYIRGVWLPWIAWGAASPTILPNDQMVFQLGEQIMWVDLSRNLAAGIAAGHGPVVTLDLRQPTTKPIAH